MSEALKRLFETYIRGTIPKAVVGAAHIALLRIPKHLFDEARLPAYRVYISTRALKHMYDKRTAAELDTILEKIEFVVEEPEYVYKNKPGKRGGFVFVRKLGGERFVCVLELVTQEMESVFEVVTAFRAPKSEYFADYEPLWERKGGTPSS